MTRAVIVTGLGFGDEGKGTTVDFLARQALSNGESVAVVRHNGGPQAAHNVVTPDGRHHTFSQFGSASFLGVETYLSQMMLVNPLNLFNEAVGLMKVGVPDPLRLLTVSPEAYVITPWHRALNQVREAARGQQRHGSCGQGVGEVMAKLATGLNLRVEDIFDRDRLSRRLRDIKEQLGDEAYKLANRNDDVAHELLDPFRSDTFRRSDNVNDVADLYRKFVNAVKVESRLNILLHAYDLVIFEGAQGILLDENYGFHPHTTWSTTTSKNAFRLLDHCDFDYGYGEVLRLGVTRTYMTRHGAGPFVTEDPDLSYPEAHNDLGKWQGEFRLGHMDVPMLDYAVRMNRGIDGLVVTHLDQVQDSMMVCIDYGNGGKHTLPRRDIAIMEHNDKTWRRQLTVKVDNLQPIYRELNPATPIEYAEFLAGNLNVPLHSVSSGPTADDKRLLESITA